MICTHCHADKPIDGFHVRRSGSAKGRHSWCKECVRGHNRAYESESRSRGAGRKRNYAGKRHVAVFLTEPEISYMMNEMSPDRLCPSMGGFASKIIRDAIAAHMKACARIAAVPVRSGWPDKRQLMAGR